MEHEYFKDRISAYFDRELKNEEEHLVAEHLKECEECQKLYQELEKFDQLAEQHSGLKDEEYWEQSAQKIERAISSEIKTEVVEIKKSQWSGLGWKVSSLVATAAVVIFIAVNYQEIQREIEPQMAPSFIAPVEDSSVRELVIDKDEMIPQNVSDEMLEEQAETISESYKSGEGIKSAEPQKKEKTDVVQSIITKPHVGIPTPIPDSQMVISKEADAVISLQETKIISDTPVPEDFPIQVEPDKFRSEKEVDEQIPHKPVTKFEETVKIGEQGRIASSDTKGFVDKEPEMEYSDTSIELSLQDWRDLKDSLTNLIKPHIKMYSVKKSSSALRDKASDQDSTEDIKDNEEDIKKRLLACYYHIALLTDNDDEYNKAYEYIEKRAIDTDYEYSDEAREYLRKLDS